MVVMVVVTTGHDFRLAQHNLQGAVDRSGHESGRDQCTQRQHGKHEGH